ncbi:MAG TPA: hypothetical protein VMF60_01600 [Acidimicrobiales bacterium]|nr:hypothetical protein [Acidimicrobiales bacterium]
MPEGLEAPAEELHRQGHGASALLDAVLYDGLFGGRHRPVAAGGLVLPDQRSSARLPAAGAEGTADERKGAP